MTSDSAEGPPGPALRLVTISAAYSAGGSVVAPALAQRLGVPFLQRVTTTTGHVTDCGPCHERLVEDEAQHHPGAPAAGVFHPLDAGGPTQSPLSSRFWTTTCGAAPRPGSSRLADGGGA